MRALLDAGDRRVDLEHISDCHTNLWAEIVVPQTEKRRGNKIGMIGMLSERGYKKKKVKKKVGAMMYRKTIVVEGQASLTRCQ